MCNGITKNYISPFFSCFFNHAFDLSFLMSSLFHTGKTKSILIGQKEFSSKKIRKKFLFLKTSEMYCWYYSICWDMLKMSITRVRPPVFCCLYVEQYDWWLRTKVLTYIDVPSFGFCLHYLSFFAYVHFNTSIRLYA